ncbi:sigma-54-dependent transcriptional regulator [Rhodohalobacter mucosus]|uniref:Sigma-54-dependent Fis family transcriptional regulator n=1 Tax=Rhodohalobacter mucosus TaxID=2079485 RepID=A0A316TVU1_9BACT|nr:sigma-54 dependent transcriptional regulator [Rhodohalobacter mucosus]PWN07961.1 sigma-54-dependent Fis family transcriptional regulator [Rhodohalobacter mucosus]
MGQPEHKLQILIADDDKDVLQAAKLLLKQYSQQVDTLSDPNQIPQYFEKTQYDVVLLDMNFNNNVSSGEKGYYWLEKIQKMSPSTAVVLITAYGDVDKAVKAIKLGATDFVLKPWQNEKLLATVFAAGNLSSSRKEVIELRSRFNTLQRDLEQPYQDIIGSSAPMQKVFETIEKVAKTDANVLITGENGTGKELVARALHRRSERSEQTFVTIDMGALTENLFESELFGHEKGAFTDAKEARAGRFEVASDGTLFLDEIGNLPLHLQPKLLSALQTHTIYRIGSNKPVKIDIRLICATNESLHALVDEQRFRQDLLYRINTIEINIPPLRNRLEDIDLLAEHFLDRYSKKYKKEDMSLTEDALSALKSYDWPGNIRELEHSIERAVILSDSKQITGSDFMLKNPGHESASMQDLNLDDLEKTAVRRALEKHEGNISRAAEELGLTRTSLYRRMDKYDL